MFVIYIKLIKMIYICIIMFIDYIKIKIRVQVREIYIYIYFCIFISMHISIPITVSISLPSTVCVKYLNTSVVCLALVITNS